MFLAIYLVAFIFVSLIFAFLCHFGIFQVYLFSSFSAIHTVFRPSIDLLKPTSFLVLFYQPLPFSFFKLSFQDLWSLADIEPFFYFPLLTFTLLFLQQVSIKQKLFFLAQSNSIYSAFFLLHYPWSAEEALL